ncbi:ABC transporter ATP-binding protein [Sphingomonas rosea]|uniref:ABC transporter ATP-binding protein n=1 Tax=Sphingomonas rosea TaxID=335605 RepID=A0ABP7UAJ9_9SPHN
MSGDNPLRLLTGALGREGRRRLVLLGMLTLVGGVAEFASLAALAALFRDWLGGTAADLPRTRLALFAGAVLVAAAVRLLLLAANQRLAFETGHRLLVAVQRRVLARDWQAHAEARSSGPLAAMELVEQWLFSGLMPVLQGASAAVLGAGILIGLLWVDPIAALAAGALLGGLFVLTTLLVRPALHRGSDTLGHDYEARVAAVQDHVGALRELILAGARGVAAERFRAIDRQLADNRTRLAILNGVPRILVESLGLVALALVAAWVAGRPGGLAAALPTLGALALGAQRLLPQLQAVSAAVNSWRATRGVQQRLAAMLAGPDLDGTARPTPLPFTDDIALEDVSFAYQGRAQPVLEGVSLTIRKGERVALVGRSGSGKSTLADLVMGLLAPDRGRLLVDGVALGGGNIEAWQRNVAHVPQAPFLADDSIARNIAFMDDAPDYVRIVQAARQVGLHELISGLPRGYETRVGERGQLLSGGQRQRLALARALYAPAPLLVLDEATSALDPQSEAHVLAALDALQAAGTTLLLIAHRPAILAGCDRLVRLEGGRAVEG